MRKTTRTVMSALMRGDSCTANNTSTDGRYVYLHGNRIIDNDLIGFTLAGYNTVTTRERVNGYLAMIGSHFRVRQIKGVPYFGTDDNPKHKLICDTDWVFAGDEWRVVSPKAETDEWGLMEA